MVNESASTQNQAPPQKGESQGAGAPPPAPPIEAGAPSPGKSPAEQAAPPQGVPTPATAEAAGARPRQKVCNLWTHRADLRCIPTTGATGPDGAAVMDSGIALEAARRYRGLELDLGRLLTSRGNHVHLIRPGLVSFPVQQYSWGGPGLQTIARSARELVALVGDRLTLLPRPGCGPGQLAWEDVAKVLSCLPDNVIVIQHT